MNFANRQLGYTLLLLVFFSMSYAGWEKLNTAAYGTLNCITVHHSSALGKVWACGDDGVILYSSNGGNSWIHQVSEATEDLYSITFKEISGGPVFAAGAGGIILRTTDDGATWSQVPSGTAATLRDHSDFGWIIVGDSGVVLRSTDNGLSWSRKESGTTSRLHSVAGAFSMYAVGDNGTVIKGFNGGERWEVAATNMRENLLGVPMFGSANFIVGAGGLILQSTNFGTTWQTLPSKTNSTLRSIEFSTNNTSRMYSVGNNGVILKTTDGGISWGRQTSPTKANLRSVFFYLSDNAGFVCGDSGVILRTTDGGGSFVSVADSLEDMFPLRVGNHWMYNYNWFENILLEIDRYTSLVGIATLTVVGATHEADSTRWILTEDVEGRYCIRDWMTRETCYTVTGSTTYELIEQHKWRHRLYRNNGHFSSWRSIVPFGRDLIEPAFLYRYWYPDSAATVRARRQDRPSYPPILYSFLFKTDSGLVGIQSRTGYLTGSFFGSDHRLITGTITDVADQHSDVDPTEFRLYQNYPNPFNPSTEIRYQIPSAGHVSLKVFDLLGREVATLVNEIKQPGTYRVTWNALGYASGVYFYQLMAETFRQTKRLLLLK